MELVAVFGGIDQILTDYLSSKNEMLLKQRQLQQIYIYMTKIPHVSSKVESQMP